MAKSPLSLLLFIFCISLNFPAFAKGTNEYVIPKGNLMVLAPPVVNKDYFAFEFGFLTEKKIKSWDYEYNAYVSATLFQDWLDQDAHVRAGGLGFRGGVILPFQPWIPLLFTSTLGYSKTVLHRKPFFGNADKNINKKDMFSLEAGLLYRIDKFFLKTVYQQSNVKYFHRHVIVSFGVYY